MVRVNGMGVGLVGDGKRGGYGMSTVRLLEWLWEFVCR